MLRTLSNRHAFVPYSLLGMLVLAAAANVSADASSPGAIESTSDINFAELRTSRAISEAEAHKSKAQLELAGWKLDQLTKLRQRGHATWQEQAQQERIVHSSASRTRIS